MSKVCDKCGLRKRYDNNNKSLLGRFWRWHINFCPGWKAYYKSLDEMERTKIKERYNLK